MFRWNLHDIDETSIDSLIPFIMRIGEPEKERYLYADEVDFL
jgi:hypothetical protein